MKFKEKICEVKKEELRKKYLVWRQKSKGKMKKDQDKSKLKNEDVDCEG